MPVTIAASSSTHFLWNGNPMPRVYRVGPFGSSDAILTDPNAAGWLIVPLGSTVGGAVPLTQTDLIAALAGVVGSAAAGGGGGGTVTLDGPVTIGGTVATDQKGGSGSAIKVDVTTASTAPVAARTDRRYVTLTNPPSNTATVAYAVGGAATLAGNPNLEPGQSQSIQTTGAINLIGSAACKIDVIEVWA